MFESISDLDVGVIALADSDMDFIEDCGVEDDATPELELGVDNATPLENSLLADTPDGRDVDTGIPCDIPIPRAPDPDVSLIPATASAPAPTVSIPV